ncbi:hypothetical protein Tco_1345277 [Tanacetum coccineum]
MSTSTIHQQSLADAGSETRPPMLERGSYIPWASRFRRYLSRKKEMRHWLKKAIAEIEAMNLILISISNDIYNSVDACTTAKAMWERVERLMRGTIQNQVDKETRFTNEFGQFLAKPGEALVLVYNRFAQLMNDLERNHIKFKPVTVNTKFLNCLQHEWLKYVTQVRLAKNLTKDSFDDIFDYLLQFEPLVNASRAKKLEKSHDPLALVANAGSSSRTSSQYYVTHPSLVVVYDDDYQEETVPNISDDPLTSTMILLARDRVNIQSKNFGNDGRNMRRSYGQEEAIQNTKDEAGVTLTDEHNDFLLADALRMEEIEELSANICLMARIQPANIESEEGPSYDSSFLSEVQTSSTSDVNSLLTHDNHEQQYQNQSKIINNTIDVDQIDSNIVFDAPIDDVNSAVLRKIMMFTNYLN